jgi:hypothetical protein
MEFRYQATPEFALEFYKENGQTISFDVELFNAILSIEAPDEDTADKIRMTITDIRMWKRIKLFSK